MIHASKVNIDLAGDHQRPKRVAGITVAQVIISLAIAKLENYPTISPAVVVQRRAGVRNGMGTPQPAGHRSLAAQR